MTRPFFTRDRNAEQIELGLMECGEHTYGQFTVLHWPGRENSKLHVGRYCSIAAGVTVFLGGNHRPEWVSMYPFNGQSRWRKARGRSDQPTTKGDVVLGSDVWVGRSATILSGVTVGHGAVVGAHAVVARDVQPYEIVAGNPARHIRFRFPPSTIERLLDAAWWDWPDEEVAEIVPTLMDADLEPFLAHADRRRALDEP